MRSTQVKINLFFLYGCICVCGLPLYLSHFNNCTALQSTASASQALICCTVCLNASGLLVQITVVTAGGLQLPLSTQAKVYKRGQTLTSPGRNSCWLKAGLTDHKARTCNCWLVLLIENYYGTITLLRIIHIYCIYKICAIFNE